MISIVVLGGTAVTHAVVLPRLGIIFEDMGEKLPALTALLYSIPRLIYVGVCVGASLALIAKEILLKNTPLKFWINFAAVAVAGLLVILQIFAMFLPLVTLIDSVAR